VIEIEFRCGPSEALASPKLIGSAQGEVDRGWQDKSADGCRAHVVGWTGIFSNLARGETGSFLRKHSNINNSGASRPHRAGVIP
jgi:hypothetical protein